MAAVVEPVAPEASEVPVAVDSELAPVLATTAFAPADDDAVPVAVSLEEAQEADVGSLTGGLALQYRDY